jgi:transcription elongation factor GreA
MELPIMQRLKKELQELKRELAVEIPKALEEAVAHGDLSENAEYEAARARQDFLRARVAQKELQIRTLSVYTLADIPKGVVAYGSQVAIENVETGIVERYQIVVPEEVDPSNGRISPNSPIGRGLMGKAVGDDVEVHTPNGKRAYEVLEVVTIHDTMAASEDGSKD